VVPAAAVQVKTGELAIRVVGPGGAALGGGVVEFRAADKTERVTAGQDGSVAPHTVAAGVVHVTVSADGFVTVEKDIPIDAAEKKTLTIELAATPPSGQLRGLIRSFNGRGLAASIRVEPLGVETKADADGNFTIDVPPGDYQVTVHAERFKPQTRKVHIDQNGVTVLNAELFEGK
jgi:hypothetical protein